MNYLKYLFVIISLLIVEPIFSQDSVSFPVKLDPTGFSEVLVEEDNIYISGQPDADSFQKLKSEGVTTVINLRTPKEMENRDYVPFDEQALVDSLGMNYINIPLGGNEYPYIPEAVQKFADEVANAKGKVLLHCTTSHRASIMWAAYLIVYKGFSPNKAIEYAKAINFGELPLEGLIGKKMSVQFE